MGYYSDVYASVKMSKEKFDEMMATKIKTEFEGEDTIGKYFGSVTYDEVNGLCEIESSYQKHYGLEVLMDLLACFKEGDDIDKVTYLGDDREDIGTYFIKRGAWIYQGAFIHWPESGEISYDEKWNETAERRIT